MLMAGIEECLLFSLKDMEEVCTTQSDGELAWVCNMWMAAYCSHRLVAGGQMDDVQHVGQEFHCVWQVRMSSAYHSQFC